MVVDGTMLIEGVKEPIAYRYPQAIASGFAIGERDSHLDIGTLTALLKKTSVSATGARSSWRRRSARPRSASEAKSRFLATMSHELRTPLNAVIGFAEPLLMHDVEQIESSAADTSSRFGIRARIC